MIASPPPVYPWPIGAGPRYQPTAANPATLAGRPVSRMRCGNGHTFAVHVELFAHRRVVVVPRGIGIARSGCTYPLSTTEPTGVVHVRGDHTLGDLFAVWGRRLSGSRLLSFRGRISVFVAGLRWRGDPRDVPLRSHGQIVVEVGPYVAPHTTYLFPKGLG